MPSDMQIAQNYELWVQHVDPFESLSREEFRELRILSKLAIIRLLRSEQEPDLINTEDN